MKEGYVRIFHSTIEEAVGGIKATKAVFGEMRAVSLVREGESAGSNLTTNKQASQEFVRDYGRGATQGNLYTLMFEVPKKILEPAGITKFYGCEEFGTNLTISVREIPDEYFRSNKEAGMAANCKKDATRREERGSRFYQLPLHFLIGIERVEEVS